MSDTIPTSHPEQVRDIQITLVDPFGTPVMSQQVTLDGLTVNAITPGEYGHIFYLTENHALAWQVKVEVK
jgi:hypothetical protein